MTMAGQEPADVRMAACGAADPSGPVRSLLLPRPPAPGPGETLIDVQLAVAAGAHVAATASPRAFDRLCGLGAAEVVDYHDPAWPGRLGRTFGAALTSPPGSAGPGPVSLPSRAGAFRDCASPRCARSVLP